MARARLLLAALLAASALAVVAAPASASVPAANTKFCTAAAKIGNTNGKPSKSQAKAAITGFKNAAKTAPSKVKSAMNNIAKYLGLVANADNAADLAKAYTSSDYKNYVKSIQTYITYYTQNCAGT